jgi:hypothetical protein
LAKLPHGGGRTQICLIVCGRIPSCTQIILHLDDAAPVTLQHNLVNGANARYKAIVTRFAARNRFQHAGHRQGGTQQRREFYELLLRFLTSASAVTRGTTTRLSTKGFP